MLRLLKQYVWNPIIYSKKPTFCQNILDQARLEKWPAPRMIHESSTRVLPIPDGCAADEKVRSAFESHRQVKFPEQYLACIPNASTLGGFVKLGSGAFLPESPWRVETFLESQISRSRYHRHKMSIDGDCYFLNTLYSGNYAHWLADELPRIIGALPFLPPTTRFLLSNSVKGYHSESLAALGISPDRIITFQGYFEIRCERLWYATPTDDMVWNIKALGHVSDALLRAYGHGSGHAPERIFVSRSKMSERKRLANDDDLLPLIDAYGFSLIRPEEMSLAEQVRAFSNARVVLGPHGAGFTNLMFCPSARLLELQDSHFAPRLWYWRWASALGNPYSSMTGPALDSKDWLDTSFSINPDALKQYLESSLSGRLDQPSAQWWTSP